MSKHAQQWNATSEWDDRNYDGKSQHERQWYATCGWDEYGHDASKASYNTNDWKTTVMLQRLPLSIDVDTLIAVIDKKGFKCTYDYVYLPMDFRKERSVGYAFVNFRSATDARACKQMFDGFADWPVRHPKACATNYALVQGYSTNVDRLKKSTLNSEGVKEEFKPRFFDEQGNIIPNIDVFGPPRKSKNLYGNGWDSSSLWDDQGYESNLWDNSGTGSVQHDRYSEQGWRQGWDTVGSWDIWQKGRDHRSRGEGPLWATSGTSAPTVDTFASDDWDPASIISVEEDTTGRKLREQSGSAGDESALDADGALGGMSIADMPGAQHSAMNTSCKASHSLGSPQHVSAEDKHRKSKDAAASAAGHDQLLPASAVGVDVKASAVGGDAPSSRPLLEMVPKCSSSDTLQSAREVPTVISAGIRYACPKCRQPFAKWSACFHHLSESVECRELAVGNETVDHEALQARCRDALQSSASSR